MNLADARKLRDKIRAAGEKKATVPLGHGPDGFFVRLWLKEGQLFAGSSAGPWDFESVVAFQAWLKMSREKHAAGIRQFLESHGVPVAPRRSAIEMMVDKACGV